MGFQVEEWVLQEEALGLTENGLHFAASVTGQVTSGTARSGDFCDAWGVPNWGLFDDPRSDHGVRVGYRRVQQIQQNTVIANQQKTSGGNDLHSPDSRYPFFDLIQFYCE